MIPPPFWTFANFLSLCRVPLSAAATVIIFVGGPVSWSLSLILVAALTDFLDGLVARQTGTISAWGKLLDPAADKISVALLGIALVWNELLPLWFLGAILLRDVLILIGGAVLSRHLGRIQMSNVAGKLAAVAIGVTFILGLLRADPIVLEISIWSTLGLLGLSLVIYALRLRHLGPPSVSSS